jgi:hypothetical protein
MNKVAKLSRIVAILIAITISVFILLANTTPLGITIKYSSENKGELVLGPKNRVESTGSWYKQLNDLVYISTKTPFSFNNATARIKFRNSFNQQILLGYQDQEEWHYNTHVLDYPLLDKLDWQKIGSGPYLFQKNATYKSVGEFLSKPPVNKIVGVYDYSKVEALQSKVTLLNYQPATTNTTINVPLRGKTIMYAYLNHEPFKMTITKRDLNLYADPDVAKISVFKAKDIVYESTINDDGDTTNNHQAGAPQTIDIKNPGPGLPEAGVYKIVIDAPGDSLITSITTNLHKIAFEGPLYVVDNHEVYGNIIAKTKPTSLITNAQQLNFRSDHDQSKTALVDKQVVNVTTPNQVYTVTSTAPSPNITIPKSDMIVNGSGYFAFSPDQFFEPSSYKILPINSADDIAQADYILTNYKPPKHEGDWLVAERNFDLKNAYIQKGQLSWLLSAPGLKENNRTVEYKQIQMTLTKKGWFRQ